MFERIATGPLSPVKDRFLSRLFKTFMISLDGEKLWNELANTLPKGMRERLHRLNVTLDDRYLSMDDVRNIDALKDLADSYANSSGHFENIYDSIFASMFYFELEDIPEYTNEGVVCVGNIFCRIDLPRSGRKYLYYQLRDASAFFMVNGRPYQCVASVPRYLPPFKRRVEFILENPQDAVAISIRNATWRPRLISRQPTTLERLVYSQYLDAPFGRPDHFVPEKPLPLAGMKRKIDSCLEGYWALRRTPSTRTGKRVRFA